MSANSKQGKLFTQWRKVLLLLLSATLLEAFSFLFIYRHFLITTTLTCFWVLFWSARAVSSQVVSKNQKERKNNSPFNLLHARATNLCKELKDFQAMVQSGRQSGRHSMICSPTGDININGSTLINCLEIELVHCCFKVLLCQPLFCQ